MTSSTRVVFALVLTTAFTGCAMKMPFTKSAPPIQMPAPPAMPPVPGTAAMQKQTLPDRELILQIRTSQTINPDGAGRASPLHVRLYQLKSAVKFSAADFFSLHDRSEAVLKADLHALQSTVVRPGGVQTITMQIGADTRYVGVFAAFQRYDSARWRAVYELNDLPNQRVNVPVDALQLSIAAVPES